MAMEWLDRVSTKPGRIKITPEDGSPAWYAVMERADEPEVGQEGTPINATNLNAMQKISTEADADADYHIAVVGDDGLLRKGKQKCSDIPVGEEVALEDIAVTLDDKTQTIKGAKQFDGGVVVGKGKALGFVHNNEWGATRFNCTNTTIYDVDLELPHESGTLALTHAWTQCTESSVEVDTGTYAVTLLRTADNYMYIYSGIVVAESFWEVNGIRQCIVTNVRVVNSNMQLVDTVDFGLEPGQTKAYKLTCYINNVVCNNWWYKKIG